MKTYIGVNNLSKEAKKIYIGYNNKALELPITTPPAPPYRVMTAKFNLSDSNPATWGSYEDDAVGMVAGSADWDAFFGHYPCILENGVELGKLNPNNMAQYEDGTSAPITTLGKDVMICFPRRGLKIWTDSGYLYVSMTDTEGVEGYTYYAHTYKGNACDKFYLGKYKGYVSSSALYSTSGQTPTASQTIGTFRTQAQARGTGYEQSAFYQLTYRQAMYMLKYLGANAQIAVGRGFVDSNSAAHVTGGTNALGMDYGENTGNVQCSLFGLEDFWGNVWEFIDGIYCNSSRQLSATDGNYNDTGSGYTTISSATASSDWNKYLRYPVGTSEGGFAPLVSNTNGGSDSTYFCDGANAYADRLASFGGRWNEVSYAGVFPLCVNRSASYSTAYVGSRLMYMHVVS